VRFGIDVSQERMEWIDIVGRTRLGEDLGFDGAWAFDHFRPVHGEGPGNCFEAMTTIAALAGATSRIRLGVLVAGVTHRHPSLLATQAVTIDHASGGRLDLGLGAGWAEGEHRALGIDFPSTAERFDLLEDALEMVTRLMTGERVSFAGRRLRLEDAQVRPTPVQRPRPPIWIGGEGRRRTLPIAARWADVWHSSVGLEQSRDLSAHLDRLAVRVGRDPASIVRAGFVSLSGPFDRVRRAVEAWREAGWGYLVCTWPDEGRRRVEEFAATVMAGR
jgi:alkanesulfonate monooxygenase SsuD/methylene tetrahydromethanopterin reductase-like flavin-dependent oxidoreductase (luciferase family)